MRIIAEKNLFKIEEQLTFLFSAILGREVEALFCAEERFCPDKRWFFFKNDTHEFAIDSGELFGPEFLGGYHLDLARLVRNLAAGFDTVFAEMPRAIPEFSKVSPLYCRNLVLLSETQQLPAVQARCAAISLDNFNFPRKSSGQDVLSRFSRAQVLLVIDLGVDEHELFIRVAKAIFKVSISRESGRSFIRVDEEKMEVRKLGLQVALADLEITLEDFLKIRPGTVIEFEHPETLSGILVVAGAKLAQVEVKVENSQVRVRVSELSERISSATGNFQGNLTIKE